MKLFCTEDHTPAPVPAEPKNVWVKVNDKLTVGMLVGRRTSGDSRQAGYILAPPMRVLAYVFRDHEGNEYEVEPQEVFREIAS